MPAFNACILYEFNFVDNVAMLRTTVYIGYLNCLRYCRKFHFPDVLDYLSCLWESSDVRKNTGNG